MKRDFKVFKGSDVNSSEFRISASDTKGNTVRNWFRCMPMMARQVEQILQSKQFPYRTKGDLFRHALHRHVKWLCDMTDNIPSVSGQVDAILEIMRDDEMNKDFDLVFSKMRDRINQHRREGDDAEAVRLVLLVRKHISGMPEGFWKRRYWDKLRQEYADLLTNTEGVNLCVLDKEE